MSLSLEQVLALAPDVSAAAAGKKLGTSEAWRRTGRSARAIWGECQGSALYQVRIDLTDLAAKCSCPSRKFPCKHALGLLVLSATSDTAVPEAEPPQWVSEWLAKHTGVASAETRARSNGRAAKAPEAEPGNAAVSTRAKRRLARVAAGAEVLELWLNDLVRNGLAGLETQPATFWGRQAARLVDAQAPGLARRVRRLAEIPNASRDWPERLLAEIGRLALLTEAFRRLDALDPDLQEDVRGAIGWTLSQEEVVARGEAVTDDWLVLGQRVTTEERLRAQWTWLLGAWTGRYALVLQYAAGSAAFPEPLVPGTRLAAELVYWPSACPQRALVRRPEGSPVPLSPPLPGTLTPTSLLDDVACALARQPWRESFPCALRGVVPQPGEEGGRPRWLLCGDDDVALPLVPGDHWSLLALSGGRPVDLAGVWDGEALLPLGVAVDGAYHLLGEPV